MGWLHVSGFILFSQGIQFNRCSSYDLKGGIQNKRTVGKVILCLECLIQGIIIGSCYIKAGNRNHLSVSIISSKIQHRLVGTNRIGDSRLLFFLKGVTAKGSSTESSGVVGELEIYKGFLSAVVFMDEAKIIFVDIVRQFHRDQNRCLKLCGLVIDG